MFHQDKQFRRPDGSLYDPSSFKVRQFEEQYGPGGVPEGWSMAARRRRWFRNQQANEQER